MASIVSSSPEPPMTYNQNQAVCRHDRHAEIFTITTLTKKISKESAIDAIFHPKIISEHPVFKSVSQTIMRDEKNESTQKYSEEAKVLKSSTLTKKVLKETVGGHSWTRSSEFIIKPEPRSYRFARRRGFLILKKKDTRSLNIRREEDIVNSNIQRPRVVCHLFHA